jgi:hypothetical protein
MQQQWSGVETLKRKGMGRQGETQFTTKTEVLHPLNTNVFLLGRFLFIFES